MATRAASKRPRRSHEIHKPTGTLHPRVQAVGPEHFGIVCVDCAKARSKWMLADFYGQVLDPPTVVEHTRAGLEAAVRHGSARPSTEHRLDRPDRRRRADRPLPPPGPARPSPPPASRSASSTRSPPSSSASPPTPATRPTTPTSPPSTAPPSTASACSSTTPTRSTTGSGSWPATAATWSARASPCAARSTSIFKSLMPGYAGCFDDIFEQPRSPLWIATAPRLGRGGPRGRASPGWPGGSARPACGPHAPHPARRSWPGPRRPPTPT